MQRMPKYYCDWSRLPLMLTINQAAVLIQITPEHLRTLCRKGIVPAMQLGQEWRIDREVMRERLKGAAR
jgi:excisionase family DNA binding protein